MAYGKLTEYFSAIGYKRLSSHEVDPAVSHGHEFQGVNSIKKILGAEELKDFPVSMLYLSETREEIPIFLETRLTWYDSRKDNPSRAAEYRLYYKGDAIQEYCNAGDLFILAVRPEKNFVIIVAEKQSVYENQLIWLFNIHSEEIAPQIEGTKKRHPFIYKPVEAERNVEEISRIILENIGIEVRVDDRFLDPLLSHFPDGFPSTRVFSDFARKSCEKLDSFHSPDATLLCWIEREELLFRTYENYLVEKRLQLGFLNVDAFVDFSLSVQNRRKSRAGFALEHHLEQLFRDHAIRFARNGITEGKSKPDFIFPGIEEYHDGCFKPGLLDMLGVKYSCKERWRQVLAEASRISEKHLFTLQPSISENQTEEMVSHSVKLVIPELIHKTYTAAQQRYLLTLKEFVLRIKEKQVV